jgi:glycosyl transferase family 2/glycosyl transferase family 1
MPPVKVSVVVPTFRRPTALARCLDALEAQEARVAEILVVVRTDDELSAAALGGREGPVREVAVTVPPGRPGFVAALNAGLDASDGAVVCFTDDDAEPRPDWISRIVAGFEAEPRLGALGGRDWVFHDGVLEQGSEPLVGVVSRWGRTTGNHHLGVGAARDVDVLKGVNLSLRGDLARSIRFDTRLLGIATEHHSELHLCLAVKRRGFRVVYDPDLAVDHRPAPRAAEAREYGPRQVHDSSHNETLALLDHLPPSRRLAHLAFATLVGSRGAPGLAQSARLGLTQGDPRLDLLRANLAGRRRALRTWRRTELLAVADSASGAARARQLLEGRPGVRLLAPADGRSALAAVAAVATTGARSLYLVDVGKVTATAAVIGRLRRRRVVLDSGDAVFALARSLGDRGFLGLALVGAGEKLAQLSADRIVVRGRLHAGLVPGNPTHIPDLAPPGARPVDAEGLRRELGLEGGYVVGLVGSLILSERLGVSYGWDLVEALAATAPEVRALVVGDGSGREGLERRARELGVAERCRFVGQVEPERVSAFVSAMDSAISTQTNDVVGRVRTTGKLPLYLACERPVLASDVGEAARLLGPHGWTIPFRGQLDRAYPGRLAERIEAWRADPAGEGARRRLAGRIAASEFDPATMRARLGELLAS